MSGWASAAQAERLWQDFVKRHPDATAVSQALAKSYLHPLSSIVGISPVTSARQNFVFVVTAYNVSPFLGSLVASLANQKWAAWKAVFIDDCSTDGTLQTLRR